MIQSIRCLPQGAFPRIYQVHFSRRPSITQTYSPLRSQSHRSRPGYILSDGISVVARSDPKIRLLQASPIPIASHCARQYAHRAICFVFRRNGLMTPLADPILTAHAALLFLCMKRRTRAGTALVTRDGLEECGRLLFTYHKQLSFVYVGSARRERTLRCFASSEKPNHRLAMLP